MAVQDIITEHLDIWTSAVKAKSASGRGSSKKLDLYGIKKLRELILELAVRGKLVPQDPNDDVASQLVEISKSKKSFLISQGVIKKSRGKKAIKDEHFYSYPKHWATARIEDLLNVINGRAYKKNEMLSEGVPLLRVGNLFTSNDWYFSDLELEPDKYIDNGDLIYAWSASFGPFIWEGGKVIYHYHIWKMDIFCDKCLDKRFSKLFLEAISERIKASGNGIAMMHMTKERMEKVIHPLPPLSEQHRIVAKVDELMALCDQLESQTESSTEAHKTLVETLLATLTNAKDADEFSESWQRISKHFDVLFTTEDSIDQLKQTILQLAVMGKLVKQDPFDEPASKLLERIAAEKQKLIKDGKIKKQKPLPIITDEEKPFGLPDGWEWCRLPDIGELNRGKSKHRPRNDPKLFNDGTIPLVQTGDVSRAEDVITTYASMYNEFGLNQSKLWPKGTMCITIAANIADTAILGFDACFPDSVVGFTPYLQEVHVKYFDYFVRTAKNHLEEFAPSTAQKNINLEILSQLLVPLPSISALNNTIEKIKELMTLCDSLKANLKDAQTTQLHLTDAIVESTPLLMDKQNESFI